MIGRVACRGADLVERVRCLVSERTAQIASSAGLAGGVAQLIPGKMLRTRLAGRLAAGNSRSCDPYELERVCAAVELVHTASLCHDDVIDSAKMRRGRQTLWRETGSSGAVLLGDLLFCAAIEVLLDGCAHQVSAFVAKIHEVCAAEIEQELRLRGRPVDIRTCLRIARGKTGPLFAFAARACGGDEPELSSALEEAGYRIGTAYQLADDLLDVIGEESTAGKTLGLDRKRRKLTVALTPEGSPVLAREEVAARCRSALECLESWPAARAGLERYMSEDFGPVLERHIGPVGLDVGRQA